MKLNRGDQMARFLSLACVTQQIFYGKIEQQPRARCPGQSLKRRVTQYALLLHSPCLQWAGEEMQEELLSRRQGEAVESDHAVSCVVQNCSLVSGR